MNQISITIDNVRSQVFGEIENQLSFVLATSLSNPNDPIGKMINLFSINLESVVSLIIVQLQGHADAL